jgi:hypothetical protein
MWDSVRFGVENLRNQREVQVGAEMPCGLEVVKLRHQKLDRKGGR